MTARMKAGGLSLLIIGLVVWSAAAFAGVTTGSDGGDTATVSAGTSSSSPGSPATTAPDGNVGDSAPSCTYTPVDVSASAGFALAPGGPTPGEWYLVECPDAVENAEWIATVDTTAPAVVNPGASPRAAAAQAAASIVLPSPSIRVNPAAFSVVNLPTWLSIDPAAWHTFQATATVSGVTATAVAVPETVTWTMGDGGRVQCNGPGTAYDPQLPAGAQSTSCAYTYGRSSVGEPSGDGDPNDGAFPVTATVSWKVIWTAVGAPGGGDLPSLQTSSAGAIRVEQVESVGVVP
jgi:hypothetical protein